MIPERVLKKAAGEGRIRGIALDTWERARAQPFRAGQQLREGVSQARALHSRERRLVQAGLYDLIRKERLYAHLLQTHEPMALWLAWLVDQGLAPRLASAHHSAPFEAIQDQQEALSRLNPVDRLATTHNLPDALARRLVEQLGEAEAADFMVASDTRAPVTLRANLLRTTRARLAERLAADDIQATPCTLAPQGLHLEGRPPLNRHRAFLQGWFEVQDEGSQLLAELVEPEGPVIDFCAGAGGKTLAIAAHGVPVIACDVRRRALKELTRRARRATAKVETVQLRDGPPPKVLTKRRASRVLVDAPCTGLGVLRRHPEHRWQFSEDTLQARTHTQQQVLARAATLVAPKGRLIYGTCSVLQEENEEAVARFLAQHKDFELLREELHTAPHTTGTDGFFGAVLQRR